MGDGAGADVAAFLDAAAPCAACGAGDRAGRQLLQSGTVRASIRFALGGRDRRRAPVRRGTSQSRRSTRRSSTRPTWNLLLAGVAGLARTAPGRSGRPACSPSTSRATARSASSTNCWRVDAAAHVFGVRWNLLLAIGGTVAGLIVVRDDPAPLKPNSAGPRDWCTGWPSACCNGIERAVEHRRSLLLPSSVVEHPRRSPRSAVRAARCCIGRRLSDKSLGVRCPGSLGRSEGFWDAVETNQSPRNRPIIRPRDLPDSLDEFR